VIKPVPCEFKARAREECARTGNSQLFAELVRPRSWPEPRDTDDGMRCAFDIDMLKTLALADAGIDLHYILTGQQRG